MRSETLIPKYIEQKYNPPNSNVFFLRDILPIPRERDIKERGWGTLGHRPNFPYN